MATDGVAIAGAETGEAAVTGVEAAIGVVPVVAVVVGTPKVGWEATLVSGVSVAAQQ